MSDTAATEPPEGEWPPPAEFGRVGAFTIRDGRIVATIAADDDEEDADG